MKRKIFIYCLVFLSIIPYDFNKLLFYKFGNIPTIIFNIIRALVCGYSILSIIGKKNLNKNQKRTILITTIFFIFILAINSICYLTSNNTATTKEFITRCLSMACVYFTMIYFIYNIKNINEILKGLKLSVFILVLFSIILYIFYPNLGKYYEGMGQYSFLGIANNRNGYVEYAILLILLSLHDLFNKNHKIVNILLILITTITVFLTNSATSKIVLVLAIIITIVLELISKKLNYNKIYLALIIAHVVLLILISINGSFAKIGDIFNKSSTLSGRTILWQESIKNIKKSTIIGYGYDNKVLKNSYYSSRIDYYLTNDTHNSLLYILLSSGIIGAIATIIFISKCVSNQKQNKQEKYLLYLNIYIIAMMIRGFSESCLHYAHTLFYIILILIALQEKIKYNNILEEEEHEK